jgi:hypothetical protein
MQLGPAIRDGRQIAIKIEKAVPTLGGGLTAVLMGVEAGDHVADINNGGQIGSMTSPESGTLARR